MTGRPRPRTILFLISDTGAGHRSAANALTAAMKLVDEQAASAGASTAHGRATQRRDTNWRTVIVDGFAECANFPLRKGVFLYGPAIKHSPRLYSQLFHLTNTVNRFNAAYRLSQPFLRQGMAQLLLRYRPDVIVSVHPLLNHITLQVMRDLGARVPFITVITDLVTVHTAWVAPSVTACVVPTEAARDFAIARGLARKRVRLLGMPIDPKFAAPPQGEPRERKLALGLDPDRPAILLVGGGEGAGGLAQAVYALGALALDAQMIVVTGRNRALRADLERAKERFRTPTRILGFVDNMPELMAASDMVVTKAGPGSISEAMACGLPLILTGYIPGQEEGNVDYVRANNLGIFADSTEKLVASVRQLLDPNDPRLLEMRANVQRLSKPRASFDIGRLILSYVPPAGAPSIWETIPRARRGRITTALDRRRRWAVRRARRFANTSVGRAQRIRALTPLSPFSQTLVTWRRSSAHPQRRLGLPTLNGARALLLRGAVATRRARRLGERA
ncbi:MAG TPA: glycosyltransferase [Ktedonobacterales bacterium]